MFNGGEHNKQKRNNNSEVFKGTLSPADFALVKTRLQLSTPYIFLCNLELAWSSQMLIYFLHVVSLSSQNRRCDSFPQSRSNSWDEVAAPRKLTLHIPARQLRKFQIVHE
jgi:hypothetical protein